MSAGALARDLAVLQDRAKLRAPFVLVASSIGGLTAEMFARQYPERVSALVLLDAANSRLLPSMEPRLGRVATAACTVRVAAWLGVIRLIDPFDLANDAEDGKRGAALTYGGKPFDALCAVARGLPASAQEFAAAPPLPAGLPVIVMSASSADGLLPPRFAAAREQLRPALLDSQKAFAAATGGTWQMVPESTHLIAESQPDAVAEAVLALLK
jgi:pimeloyl-ACP methyl ester carboxylesterase